MAEDNCKQTNVPETDNTPLDCPSYILDKCVIIPEGNAFIGTNDDNDLFEHNEKLIEKLIAQNQRITVLEGSNSGTTTFEFNLTGTTLTLDVNSSTVASIDLISLATAGVQETKQVFTATGGENTFVVSNTINTSYTNQLIVEGLVMLEGIGNDYNITGNTVNLTLAAPLQAGNIVQFIYKY